MFGICLILASVDNANPQIKVYDIRCDIGLTFGNSSIKECHKMKHRYTIIMFLSRRFQEGNSMSNQPGKPMAPFPFIISQIFHHL